MTTVQTGDVDGRNYVGGNQPGFRHVDSFGVQSLIKSNLDGFVDPGATDDSGAGYSVGSEWINVSTGKVWTCVNASSLAAVWKDLSSSGASVGGSNGQLLYNNSGAIDGVSSSIWDGSLLTTNSHKINGQVIVNGRLCQIQLDYPVTTTLAPNGRRNWLFTDKDGANNRTFNCIFSDNNGSVNPADYTWTSFDPTKPCSVDCLDSNADWNFYYAFAGINPILMVPSLIRMTGVNALQPQLIISPKASVINNATAHLLIHNDVQIPRVLITDGIGNEFSDGNTSFEIVRSGSTYLRVRNNALLGSNGAGGGIVAMGSDDSGNNNKQIYIQVGRYLGFSGTMHGILATNCPAGLIISGDNNTNYLQCYPSGNIIVNENALDHDYRIQHKLSKMLQL